VATPERILIVRMSALGDIVHALPVLSALHQAFPGVQVDWLTETAYNGILDFVEGVTTRLVVRPGYRRALQVMRSRRYDAALDLQGLLKSAVAARLSGATRVVGFETRVLRERAAAWFYSETASIEPDAHIVRKNLAILAALGVNAPAIQFPLRVPASAVAERVAGEAPAGFALLNPGAAWPNKRWHPARFGEIAAQLRGRFGLPSYVLWGPSEAALADAVVTASNGAALRAPQTTLGDVLALSQRAALLVSGDTGPLHLAAAIGTPIVGLYGPTWPERNGPWDSADEVVSQAASCVCHHKRACLTGRMCINDIQVSDVFAAVERRLARARR
jgi:lipopolysaccharide heptosyltransferase I